jgi:hypothetical protein
VSFIFGKHGSRQVFKVRDLPRKMWFGHPVVHPQMTIPSSDVAKPVDCHGHSCSTMEFLDLGSLKASTEPIHWDNPSYLYQHRPLTENRKTQGGVASANGSTWFNKLL